MSKTTIFTGGDIVTPFRTIHDGVLVAEGGIIDQVGRRGAVTIPKDGHAIDVSGKTILPGFIDLHLHGMVGHSFDSAGDEELEAAAEALAARGTTSALITLVPAPPEKLLSTVSRTRAYLERTCRNTVFCGMHLEGPFLNPEMHGALDPNSMWRIVPSLAERLFAAAGSSLKLMTLAPELSGAMDLIRRAVRHGVVASVGHSQASYSEMEDAIDCGLTQVTHIFNAMPLAHHRDPGVLGAAYTHQQLKVQLIADGIHVHPAIMSFLVKVKGPGSILLVSDAMPACGLPDGDYKFAGSTVRLRAGSAKKTDGTLAGAVQALDGAVRNLVKLCDVSIGDAARMAGLNAARVLNLDKRLGILAAGFDADFVVMDANMEVEMTVSSGGIVYRSTP